MLYDPKWEKPEVKADPLSLDSLIAWMEKQPLAQSYEYCDPQFCLLGQFASHNDSFAKPHGEEGHLHAYKINGVVCDFQDLSVVATRRPHTYDAALSRARALRDRS